MTKTEWDTASDPLPMLSHLFGPRMSPRKLRLAAVASYRLIWDTLSKQARLAVSMAEQHADGLASDNALRVELEYLEEAGEPGGCATELDEWEAIRSAADRVPGFARRAMLQAAGRVAAARADRETKALMCRCLRDIFQPFGKPRQPLADINPQALAMAASVYDERLPIGHLDSHRLAVLADAIEEASCTDDELLMHLRDAGPHVRGCWALDLVLGKV